MPYQMMVAVRTYGGCTTVECRSVDKMVACCVRGTLVVVVVVVVVVAGWVMLLLAAAAACCGRCFTC